MQCLNCGKETEKKYCNKKCDNQLRDRAAKIYKLFKKDYCEKCGYKGKYLTIDHKDNDVRNNQEQNLQTLCRVCHLIKDKPAGSGNKWKKLLKRYQDEQTNS